MTRCCWSVTGWCSRDRTCRTAKPCCHTPGCTLSSPPGTPPMSFPHTSLGFLHPRSPVGCPRNTGRHLFSLTGVSLLRGSLNLKHSKNLFNKRSCSLKLCPVMPTSTFKYLNYNTQCCNNMPIIMCLFLLHKVMWDNESLKLNACFCCIFHRLWFSPSKKKKIFIKDEIVLFCN